MKPVLALLAALPILLPLASPLLRASQVSQVDEPVPTLAEAEAAARRLRAPDERTLVPERSFFTGWPAMNPDGTLNVVVEIPAGTLAKWEVDRADGALRHELVDGEPRLVRYLPYPANYGMVPRTLLPESDGGDGDPLDVVLVGPAVVRGAVVAARPVAVLRMTDGGERDDKIVAMLVGSPLDRVRDLDELDEAFPGACAILETWFSSYKGVGAVEARGWGTNEDAEAAVRAAMAAYGEWRRAGGR